MQDASEESDVSIKLATLRHVNARRPQQTGMGMRAAPNGSAEEACLAPKALVKKESNRRSEEKRGVQKWHIAKCCHRTTRQGTT